ncbi:MAG TPA: hypothetical protein VGI10_14530 [Polyangiaceae bacterium]
MTVDTRSEAGWKALPDVRVDVGFAISFEVPIEIESTAGALVMESTGGSALWNGRSWSQIGARTQVTALGVLRSKMSKDRLWFSLELWDTAKDRWRELDRNRGPRILEARSDPLSLVTFPGGDEPQATIHLLERKNGALAEAGSPLALSRPIGRKLEAAATWWNGVATVLTLAVSHSEADGGDALLEPHVWQPDGDVWREIGDLSAASAQ